MVGPVGQRGSARSPYAYVAHLTFSNWSAMVTLVNLPTTDFNDTTMVYDTLNRATQVTTSCQGATINTTSTVFDEAVTVTTPPVGSNSRVIVDGQARTVSSERFATPGNTTVPATNTFDDLYRKVVTSYVTYPPDSGYSSTVILRFEQEAGGPTNRGFKANG